MCKKCSQVCCSPCFTAWTKLDTARDYAFPCLCTDSEDLPVKNRLDDIKKVIKLRCPYQKKYNKNYNEHTPPCESANRCDVIVPFVEFFSKRDSRWNAPLKFHLSECRHQPYRCDNVGCDAIVSYESIQSHRENCTSQKTRQTPCESEGCFGPQMKRPKLSHNPPEITY